MAPLGPIVATPVPQWECTSCYSLQKSSPIGKPLDTKPGLLDPRALTAVTLTVRF